MRRKVVGVVLTSLLAMGCAAEQSTADRVQLETVQLPIKGGYNSTDSAVVGLGMASQGGFGTCSGTIISPNVVLTAQHCIASMSTENYVDCSQSSFGPTQDPFWVFVTNASPMPWDEAAYVRSQEIRVPEISNWACGYDIALLILENPIPWNVSPMIPRVDTPPVVGDVYSAIGYGATSGQGGGSGTRRRRDDLVVNCGPTQCPNWYPMEPSEWIGDTGVCQGDSGGPAIDEFGRVIGVASRGGEGCSSPVYSGVSPWGEWIKETVVYAAGLANLETPPWALGWPTHPGYSYPIGGWCEGPGDCDSGLCVSGICTRMCADNAPCPSGLFCSADEVCEVVPVGDRCVEDAECLGDWCLDGTCSRTCSVEMPCPDGFECDEVSGGCRPEIGVYCTDNDGCASQICLGALCTRECDADPDCPAGWNCTNGACLLDKVGMGCKDDLACPGGFCLDGLCSRACADNAPCPAGYRCNSQEGYCALVPAGDPCVEATDCNYSTCHEGICTRSCSSEAPCPAGLHCDNASGLCAESPVGNSCQSDDACVSGLCVDDTCTRTCSAQATCPMGYSCLSGVCQVPSAGHQDSTPTGALCASDTDCPGGTCEAGECMVMCSTAAPCQKGFYCAVENDLLVCLAVDSGGCASAGHESIPGGGLVLLMLLFLGWRRRETSLQT